MHAYVHDTQFFGPNNRNCCQGDYVVLWNTIYYKDQC